jgi:hypothetical protein
MLNRQRRTVLFGAGMAMAVSLLGFAPSANAATDSINAANVVGAPLAAGFTPADGVELASAFPSANSTVIGSVGFVDDDEVGYFWSAARGDSVTQVVKGPAKIKHAILKVEVVYNGLAAGEHTAWNLEIDGDVVGDFDVQPGFTGVVKVNAKFAKKTGGEYEVAIRMTNEVAPGGGAITLAYAGDHAHSINLKRR